MSGCIGNMPMHLSVAFAAGLAAKLAPKLPIHTPSAEFLTLRVPGLAAC